MTRQYGNNGLLACLIVALAASNVPAGDWPQWRGPLRNGICTETGLMSRWPAGGPPLAWKTAGLGTGYASLVVADGRVFTIGRTDGAVYARAIDDDDGGMLWATKIGQTGRMPLSTPTVDGQAVYCLDPDGQLHRLAVADGKVKWKRSFVGEFGGALQNGRGFAESPLIDGDFLVGTPGGDKHTMVKLDKQSGKTAWSCAVPVFGPKGRRGTGFSSIVPANVAGVRHYVQQIGRGLIGVRARDGKFLWGYNRIASQTANIPTPVVIGDRVFCANGYNAGAALVKLVAAPGGGLAVREEFFLRAREFQNHHGGFVHVDGHIFGGHGSNNGLPTCIELETGEVLWKRRGPGSGSASVIYADGHLYMKYANGVMALVEASTEGYRLKGKFRIPEAANDSWSHPVIANGKLYLREKDSLFVYDIRAAD